MGILNKAKEIIIENDFAEITLSKKDGKVIDIVDKTTGNSIKGEDTFFFSMLDSDKNPIATKSLSFGKDSFTLTSEKGEMTVKTIIYDNYMTFEVMTSAPKGVYGFSFISAKYKYEYKKDGICAADMAMTINTNPCFYPGGDDMETRAECYEHLGGCKGAKIALAIVPTNILRDVLKEIADTIDRNKGLVSKIAGPYARDNGINFGSYIIAHDTREGLVADAMKFYEKMGVDQVDFHQGDHTFRQGDMQMWRHKSAAEFKEKVVDGVLHPSNMEAGLHTYAFYINFFNEKLLSDPENQKMLQYSEEFTLGEDITENTDYIKTVESTADISDYYGFFSTALPYILIGEEMIRFVNAPDGFKECQRGVCGTKAVNHKKGEKIRRLKGYFTLFCPEPGSRLFLDVAKYTAEAYNDGGFAMIYLDALDGIGRHCDGDDAWYYCAQFVHEIVKNCKTDPIIEYSTMYPSIWAARGRMGAMDTPYRSYKNFLRLHHLENQKFVRRHYACTLGWYNYYPQTDKYPGNQHTKYHHIDSIDYMGAMSVMYDYSTVYDSSTLRFFDRIAGMRRNVARYKEYADVRRKHLFSEETLEKMRNSPYEFSLRKKDNGKYVFDEKHYDIKRLYDIADENRNTAEFTNPFKSQTPFIRIEADMSTMGNDPMILLPLDENKPLVGQGLTFDFGGETNLENNLAMKVRVTGNGKKGSAIAIKTRCASNSEFGYGEYIIDTDFAGTREFVLLEADNGDRPDLPFDKKEHLYPIYRSGLNCDRMVKIAVETCGDMEGVRMSSIVACQQTYNVFKNPTVTIGKGSVMFECELMSTDFIEYNGKSAKVIDRYGNEKPIWFDGNVTAPKGKFKATLTAKSLNNCPMNAHLTIGTTGKEIK